MTLDRKVVEVGGDVRVVVNDTPERAAVVPALVESLAADFELRLVTVNDPLEPGKLLRHQSAGWIEEGTRPGATD